MRKLKKKSDADISMGIRRFSEQMESPEAQYNMILGCFYLTGVLLLPFKIKYLAFETLFLLAEL